MSILATERDTYTEMWSGVDHYGHVAPGEKYLPVFLQLVDPGDRRQVTVLDAGTGSGKGAAALYGAGFDVRACDMTDIGIDPTAKGIPYYDACLWQDLSHTTRAFGHPNRTKADYVYCTDVLEHVPTQLTMLAVDQMLRVAKHGLFLAVSMVAEHHGVWMGRTLHQTVQPFLWWKASLAEVGTVREARDLLTVGIFYVEPKK
jgi:2-polyprenyl-3-methyl-5-hydroxy-6-metoxy-1,4-benzoquinol methylase